MAVLRSRKNLDSKSWLYWVLGYKVYNPNLGLWKLVFFPLSDYVFASEIFINEKNRNGIN